MSTTCPRACARIAASASAGAIVALLAGAALAEAPVQRLVIAMNPPPADTNLVWGGSSNRMPSMFALVGHDPITGEYDTTELARSWEANEDFTEWTFHLHEDAEFHFDWGPVTAEDVVHSYELHTQEGAIITGLEHLRAKEVEATGPHSVVFRFDEPRTDYLFHHAGRGSMVVYSKAQWEAEGEQGYIDRPAGTAPYRYVERRTGEGVVYERVEDHWTGILPDFPELETRWAPEPSTQLAMILAGEAHIVALPRELQADALAAGKHIVASHNPAMSTAAIFNGLYMQTGDPAFNPDLPWADIRVREAMNRAIDRDALIDVLYDGRAEKVPSYAMDRRHKGHVPELEERFEAEYGYDPERAKELLAEAGYPDAFPDPVIPIVSSVLGGNPEFPTMMELLQVYFEEIGLQTVIREMDWASLGALGRAREAYVIGPLRNAPIRPTQAGLINFYTRQGTPYGGYETDRSQELADALTRAIDPDERERIAREMFVYLFEQYADMPLAALSFELVVDPEVVADWPFPGVSTDGVSHYHLIEAAR